MNFKTLFASILLPLNFALASIEVDLNQYFNDFIHQIENQEIEGIELYKEFSLFKADYSKLNQTNKLRFTQIQNEIFPVKSVDDGINRQWIREVNRFGLLRESALNLIADEYFDLYYSLLNEDNQKFLMNVKKEIESVSEFQQLTKEQIQDLFYKNNSTLGISIIVFCRDNRAYPCLMTVKDLNGNPTYDSDGQLWTIPVLAKSSRGLEYFQRNGNTPQGFQRIDGVMPEADQFRSFGKFRRLILNFFHNAQQENQTLKLIPESVKDMNFWKEALISRDAGRSNLRIHGTGKINEDPSSTYYPHRMTSGCISTREGLYKPIEYIDQRVLLDHLMKSMNLQILYQNEAEIRGSLLLVELDQAESKVTLEDLNHFGIQTTLN